MSNLLIIDKYTGEQCKYVETEFWYDNTTPMNDTLCDHVIYIQHEHKYYKRVLNGYITVKMFGAIGDGLTDDSESIQKAVDFCEKTSQKTLFFPPGDYFLNTPIENTRGGVKFIGSGALLREESWWTAQQPHSPFSGCSLIIPKDSSAFVYKESVTESVYIESIQFLAKEGRNEGKTYAIDFKSEFNGPTWPFIIRDCHFRGFNRAISFKSENVYNVAWVQVTGSAFSQNDECVYFDFANDLNRNMSWGFVFENNKCHNNSRVIYGYFAKDMVRIVDNNFEGSIPYSYDLNDPKSDHYSVDIEIDNAVVQFFGNHFEGMASNAVYISSLRKDINGEYIYTTGTTALSNRNRVEIFGNNMDGMYDDHVPEQIKFNLTGIQVINKDDIILSVHACEIVENITTKANIFLNPEAKENGTIIKFSGTDGSSYLFNNTLDNYDFKKLPVSPKSILIDGEQYESRGNESSYDTHYWGGYTFPFYSRPEYLGATFKIKSRLDVFTANVFFNTLYYQGGSIGSQYTKEVMATLFQKSGDSLIVAIIPNKDYYPAGTDVNAFTADLSINNLDRQNILVATDVTYFTFAEKNPSILPYYKKSNVVDKYGTFYKGQHFVDTSSNLNIVIESGTLDKDDFLLDVTASGTAGDNFITTNQPQKLTTGQYIKIPNAQESYMITGCKDGVKFYLNKILPTTFTDSQCVFAPPVISII